MGILEPSFSRAFAQKELLRLAQETAAIIAHPRDVAEVYGINPQSVHDAKYKDRVVWDNYLGRSVLRWVDVEATWGVRPDRFSILLTDDVYALYEVNPVKQTVIRFIDDFLTEDAARREVVKLGVKRKFAQKVKLEHDEPY